MYLKSIITFLGILSAIAALGQSPVYPEATFSRETCSNLNDVYTYEDYQEGFSPASTVKGYRLYRNGTLVFQKERIYPCAFFCLGIDFINDSVGFLVDRGCQGTCVNKTVDYGQTWTSIGCGLFDLEDIYAVNENYVYLMTSFTPLVQFNPNLQLGVTRCSDIEAPPALVNLSRLDTNTFIYDTLLTADIYKTDTVLGEDLCGIDSLKAIVIRGEDTVTYYINIASIPVGINNQKTTETDEIVVYPDPTHQWFSLNEGLNDLISVELISATGELVKQYDLQSIYANKFEVADLAKGLYIAQIVGGSDVSYRRILVN